MAKKTITLELDAYEKLRQAKRGGESFAATALVHGLGVVTNNVDEFSRVPGVTVVPY